MHIIDQIGDSQTWRKFWEYKLNSGHTSKKDIDDLFMFYKQKEYLPVVEKIKNGLPFEPPTKKLISKIYSEKKRTVYTFNREENYVLKLITYLILREYDSIFSPNLYSFRVGNGVQNALSYLTTHHRTDDMYVYKTDICNYFNSVDIGKLMPILSEILIDDTDLYIFIRSLLEDPRVIDEGKIKEEPKGIMAGNPLAAFLADVYLSDLDWSFYKSGNIYARYSDDIIIFSPTEAERSLCVNKVKTHLSAKGLKVNEKKERFIDPHNKWEFLGISYLDGTVDVSDISAEKLKKKMRRKSRALVRWKNKKGADGARAAKAFVKTFNKKLYDNPINDELTWTRWYFPLINTDETLNNIDRYEQDCIRYIATEKRTKGRFVFTYDDMKRIGYKCLVHEYYQTRKETVKKAISEQEPSKE